MHLINKVLSLETKLENVSASFGHACLLHTFLGSLQMPLVFSGYQSLKRDRAAPAYRTLSQKI